VQMVNKPHPH